MKIRLFKSKILKEAMDCLGIQDDTPAARKLASLLQGCTEKHEDRHISWFLLNDPDACDGICPCETVDYPGRTRQDSVNNCIDAERDAYENGN